MVMTNNITAKIDWQNTKKSTKSFITRFLYGKLFPLVLGGICLICHSLQIQLVGLAIFCLIATLVLCVYKDATPFLPLGFLVIYNFTDYTVTSTPLFFIILAPPVLSFFVLMFRAKCKTFSLGNLFLPLACCCFALITGGLFSYYMNSYVNGLLQVVVFGPLVLFIYLFFLNYITPPKDFDLKNYLAFLLFVSAIVCNIESIISSEFKFNGMFISIPQQLGWGNLNTASTMTILALPVTFYLLATSKRKIVYAISVIFFTYMLFSLDSEGCIAIAMIVLIPSLFLTYKMLLPKQKRYYLGTLFAIAFIVLVLILIFRQQFYEKICSLYNGIIESFNGRLLLYEHAVDLFLENPLFGASMGYNNQEHIELVSQPLHFFNLHSSLLHPLGKLGIIGLGAYCFLYFSRFKLIIKNTSRFNLFILLTYGSFFTYGLVDTCEFNIIPCVVVVTILFSIIEILNKKEGK